MQIRDIMTANSIVVRPDTTVNEIARLMYENNISGVPVVDEAGSVVGIITELDMIVRNTRLELPAFVQILDGRILLETPAHYEKRLRHMLGTRAQDIMTRDVVTIKPETEVEDVAALMVKRRVNPVPVVENGVLVGIVSRSDIIRMMIQTLAEEESPEGAGAEAASE
jgi:CBS domain-containing protein